MKKFVCGLMAVGLALTGCGSQSSAKDKADHIRDLRILL